MNIRVAAASLNQIPLDFIGNKGNILEAIHRAKKNQASILVLPELCLTGYGCEDWFLSKSFANTALDQLFTLLPDTAGLFVNVGLPLFFKEKLYNATAVIFDKKILGFVLKKHLAFEGVYYENRWFSAWPSEASDFLDIKNQKIPVGDLTFESPLCKIGYEVCEEAWVKDRPAYDLAKNGVQLILNPSASHFAFGKQEVRKELAQKVADAHQLHYIYSNLLGNESGRLIFDGSLLIAGPNHSVLESKRFSFERLEILFQDLKVEPSKNREQKTIHSIPLNLSPLEVTISIEKSKVKKLSKEEEFSYAVALGLFDYLRKSHSQGFILSLSGGADSTAVATLVYLMFRLAQTTHGKEFWETSFSEILTCLYQGTENNSQASLQSAKEISKALGAKFLEWRLDKVHQQFMEFLSASSDLPLSWETQDLALQNIQSRLRVPAPWFLANLKKSLLLVTSNRSEVALGYSTMDGDTSGSLAPIAGVDKAFLLHWLKWMETTGIEEVGPITALRWVNQLKPSPELKPKSHEQTTEKELMPFSLLTEIEKLVVVEKLNPLEVFEQLSKKFPEEKKLKEQVTRFFNLFSKNQWKRERLAPSFHLDDENLDPKSFFRFPILNSGFGLELKELEK